jgi:hypothetical protein
LPPAALPEQWTLEQAAEVAGVAKVVLAPGLWPTCDGTTVPPTPIDPVAVVFTGEVADQVLAAVLDVQGHWWLGSHLSGEIVCWGWYRELEHALEHPGAGPGAHVCLNPIAQLLAVPLLCLEAP